MDAPAVLAWPVRMAFVVAAKAARRSARVVTGTELRVVQCAAGRVPDPSLVASGPVHDNSQSRQQQWRVNNKREDLLGPRERDSAWRAVAGTAEEGMMMIMVVVV